MDQMPLDEFRIHLQNQLTRRSRNNPRYSLRSFSRLLNLDPSSVSQIMSGKRNASAQMMENICSKIGWPRAYEPIPKAKSDYHLLSQDAFAAIADWYHYAILDLTLLKDFQSEVGWIAKRIGISKSEAKIAVDRLKRLGMLVEKSSRLKKGQLQYVNYVEGQTSEAHKEYQRQIIQKALDAVDNTPAEDKDITCITIAADSKKIEAARQKIKKFRRDLCAFLEAGEGDSVHILAVQLFPLSRKD